MNAYTIHAIKKLPLHSFPFLLLTLSLLLVPYAVSDTGKRNYCEFLIELETPP